MARKGTQTPARTLRLRRLGAELVRRREASGLSREEAAERLEVVPSTLYRIEVGQARPQARTLRDLLNLYAVTGEERDALLTLSKEAAERGWWQSYDDVLPSDYTTFIGMETEASSIRTFQPSVVPGMLQTEDYARALARGELAETGVEEVERQVEARMARQEHVTKDDPQLWAVLDEAVLRRPVGGPGTMAVQLRQMATASAKLPRVTVQVIPFAAGPHPGLPGSFVIFGFPEPIDPDVVYLEGQTGGVYLEEPDEIRQYELMFSHLTAMALSPDDSRAMLTALADEMSSSAKEGV